MSKHLTAPHDVTPTISLFTTRGPPESPCKMIEIGDKLWKEHNIILKINLTKVKSITYT